MYPPKRTEFDTNKLSEDEYEEGVVTTPEGVKVKKTYYNTGETITHYGGPVGDGYTDENGES